MLSEVFPPDYSGAGIQLRTLAPCLQRLGVSVRVLTSIEGARSTSEVYEGIPVERLAIGPREEGWADRFARKATNWMWQNRRTYDIVHFHGIGKSTWPAIALAVLLGKRRVLKLTMAHDESPTRFRAMRFGKIRVQMLHLVNRVVCISTALVAEYQAHGFGSTQIIRIPNGVDVSTFAPMCKDLRAAAKQAVCSENQWSLDSEIVLFIGGIERRKGLDILIEAWPIVLDHCPAARLLLVGPKDHSREAREFAYSLEQGIAEASFRGTARCTGNVGNPERYMQIADVFVLPSRNEGLPNALIEAQAVGVACVSTMLQGITSDVIVDGVTGLIVPQESPGELARALVRLLEHPEERVRMGAAARARAVESFNIDAIAKQYQDLYLELSNVR